MSSVNKCIILGRVGKDPEIKQFQSGDKVASFSIATSETWKDKQSGEKKEKTEWVNISVRGDGLVRIVENYVKKGSQLYVEGSLQTRKWRDSNGNDRYTTEVVVSGFGGVLTLLGGKGNNSGRSDYESQNSNDDFEDEIPFN